MHGFRSPEAVVGGTLIALVSSEAAAQEVLSTSSVGVCMPIAPGMACRRVDVAYFYPEQHAYECIVQAKLLKESGNRLLGEGQVKAALDR